MSCVEPSGAPTILDCEAILRDDDILLTIEYERIQSAEWNGVPVRYDVVIQHDNRTTVETASGLVPPAHVNLRPSLFNESSIYQVTMAGVNSEGRGPFTKPPCDFDIPS